MITYQVDGHAHLQVFLFLIHTNGSLKEGNQQMENGGYSLLLLYLHSLERKGKTVFRDV